MATKRSQHNVWRINAALSKKSHKIIENHKLEHDFLTKEEALDDLIQDYERLKNGKSK